MPLSTGLARADRYRDAGQEEWRRRNEPAADKPNPRNLRNLKSSYRIRLSHRSESTMPQRPVASREKILWTLSMRKKTRLSQGPKITCTVPCWNYRSDTTKHAKRSSNHNGLKPVRKNCHKDSTSVGTDQGSKVRLRRKPNSQVLK